MKTPLRLAALVPVLALAAAPASAQFHQATAPARRAPTWAYDVIPIPAPPGGAIHGATDVTETGVVVGTTYFTNPVGERGWVWTAAQGLQLLPQPPVGTSWRAIGINESGVIAGDGGIDFGVAWRLENGVYEVLGTLAGDVRSTAAAINEAGEIVGTSQTLSIMNPPNAFLGAPGQPLQLVQASGQASAINDAGQVVGWTSSLTGFRWTPGAGSQFLPPLGQRVQVIPTSINAAGDVVGVASHANGNASVPFLFTDDGGMQAIGSFGGGAAAADLDSARNVVGNFGIGGDFPWIWDAARGVRFLDDLIDPALGLHLILVRRITESGLVLARATDASFRRYPVLLVPAGR